MECINNKPLAVQLAAPTPTICYISSIFSNLNEVTEPQETLDAPKRRN